MQCHPLHGGWHCITEILVMGNKLSLKGMGMNEGNLEAIHNAHYLAQNRILGMNYINKITEMAWNLENGKELNPACWKNLKKKQPKMEN